MRKHGLFVLACSLAWIGTPCQGQQLASMPYSHLLKIAQGDVNQKKDAETYKLKISSTKGIAPEKIQLVLQSREDPIHLIVDDQGYFEVPNNPALRAENPMLVANQPKGTLNITFTMKSPPFKPPQIKDGKIKYKDLFQPLLDVQNAVRKVDPTFGLMGKDQFALMIKTDKPIKVNRPLGVRTYRPDEEGIILLIMEAFYFKENADVEIPGKVEMKLIPVTAADAEKIKAAW